MKLTCVTSHLVAFGALLTAGQAVTQIANAATPTAYVYVQTAKGVMVYSAASTGQLTKVSGSPFADTGQMGAINGSYMIAVGTGNLRTYPIESNGGIGKQAGIIDTQSYGGSACGTNLGGALFDHTGKYFYVLLGGSATCSAMQSYKLASNGSMTFIGDTENSEYQYHDSDAAVGISTISGSDTFAYGIVDDVYANLFTPFTIKSNGLLVATENFTQTGPTPDPNGVDANYYPNAVAADTTNHLAVVVNEPFTNSPPAPQLASFTINSSTGSVVSTNTYANMPTPAIYPALLSMSWTGKQLAVASQGVEIYNFNGASPMTLASKLIDSSRNFGYIAWDKNNHLYAVDYTTGNLYVYTVGATTITEAPGSPYTIPSNVNPIYEYGLIVVPK